MYYQVLNLTEEEQKKLYESCSHDTLVSMLIECNKHLKSINSDTNPIKSTLECYPSAICECIHSKCCNVSEICDQSACKYYTSILDM